MLNRLYYIDISTILTLMTIGVLIGYMLGKRFMDMKMLILLTIVFLIGTFLFLDARQPDGMPKQQAKHEEKQEVEDLEPASGTPSSAPKIELPVTPKLIIESSKKE